MRTSIMTLAYNRPHCVKRVCEILKETNPNRLAMGVEHVIIDVHYPLPGYYENAKELLEISNQYQATFLRPYRNQSVARNWQWAWNEMCMGPNDFLIGLDPDSNPKTPGWIEAMAKVAQSPRFGYIGLNRVDFEAQGYNVKHGRIEVINGIEVYTFPHLISWSFGGFHGRFVSAKGISETHAVYGGIEHACYDKMKSMKLDFCMLKNYYDEHMWSPDPEYQQWKSESAGLKTKLHFDAWLAQRKP